MPFHSGGYIELDRTTERAIVSWHEWKTAITIIKIKIIIQPPNQAPTYGFTKRNANVEREESCYDSERGKRNTKRKDTGPPFIFFVFVLRMESLNLYHSVQFISCTLFLFICLSGAAGECASNFILSLQESPLLFSPSFFRREGERRHRSRQPSASAMELIKKHFCGSGGRKCSSFHPPLAHAARHKFPPTRAKKTAKKEKKKEFCWVKSIEIYSVYRYTGISLYK